MRIAHVKQSYSTYSENEIDKLNDSIECLNCHSERIILTKITNQYTTMKVCVNPKCFLYTNITKLQSWIKK